MDIPTAASADGTIGVWWVDALANPSAPSAAAINSGVKLHCYLTPDGWNAGLDEQARTSSRLCSVQDFEGKGRHKRTLNLKYVENPQVPLDNLAYTTMVPGTGGFLVERRGIEVEVDETVAAGDVLNVWPAQPGEYQPQPPEANSDLKQMQNMFVTGPVIMGAVAVA